jgi:hypothetical protein
MDVSIFKGSWVTWDIDRGGSMRRLVALLKKIFIMISYKIKNQIGYAVRILID